MVHPNLVIPAELIQKVVHFMARDCVKYIVRKWEGKFICDGDGVQLPVIDAYPDFPILLGDYDDWVEP